MAQTAPFRNCGSLAGGRLSEIGTFGRSRDLSDMPKLIFASLAAVTLASAPAYAQSTPGSKPPSSLSVSFPDGVTQDMLGSRQKQVIAVQVMLDRSRHSPGVIDGYMGGNTRRAIGYYRQANDLPSGQEIDGTLVKSLLDSQGGDIFRTYTITEEDVSRTWSDIPSDFAELAKLDNLGYKSPQEMLAERFHMDQEFLRALNSDADFGKAGTELAIVSHGDEALSAKIARIEVRKGDKAVVALDSSGKLLASYPATIGSSEFPSPSGKMEVAAIAAEPKYYFDPEDQNWGPDKRLVIAAGPNNPIGGTWIDLGKDGYGIHGSPDPKKVAKRASHGCVRLTNWDAYELAHAVTTGTPVAFV